MVKVSQGREIGEIKVKVNEIHKLLLGNGQPGLVQNFSAMGSRMDKFEGGLSVVKGFLVVFGVMTVGYIVVLIKG
jgi:hypothetical protein